MHSPRGIRRREPEGRHLGEEQFLPDPKEEEDAQRPPPEVRPATPPVASAPPKSPRAVGLSLPPTPSIRDVAASAPPKSPTAASEPPSPVASPPPAPPTARSSELGGDYLPDPADARPPPMASGSHIHDVSGVSAASDYSGSLLGSVARISRLAVDIDDYPRIIDDSSDDDY